MSDKHAPVGWLVGRADQNRRDYERGKINADAYDAEWQRIEAAADALDAQTWQPVEDGDGAIMPSDSPVGVWVYEDNRRISLSTSGMEIFATLPDDVRLCRRVAAPQWPTGDEAAERLALEWHFAETKEFNRFAHGVSLEPDKTVHERIAAAVLRRLNGSEGDDGR